MAVAGAARRSLRIGTRGSPLALAQTNLVSTSLRARYADLEIHVVRITTKGDILRDQPLASIGGRGVFVGELEAALRAGEIDVAVHSAKDLPSRLASDMVIAAFPPRGDARDVLVSRSGRLDELPPGARVGTSSPRRACQIRALRADVEVADVRGNVDTRLRKVAIGEYDALVLAAAGLIRLARESEATEWLEAEQMIPAVGQGALAIETRFDDQTVATLIGDLDDPATRVAVTAERSFLARLGAGCTAAAGAHAELESGDLGMGGGRSLTLAGMIGSVDGRLVRGVQHGSPEEADAIGVRLAEDLLARGGAEFLAAATRDEAARES
ncbi:MAG: hydroxymethylbilane synthase [Anaerolineae bacterium]|nr:hydroxymethylbilane synthase [Gemmatimonadaceae bacterium]